MAAGNGLIEAAPGVFVDPVRRREFNGTGEREWLHLNDAGLERIGLSAEQLDTIFRLGEAEIIKVSRVTPRLVMLHMPTWRRHLEDCAADPWRWDEGGPLLRRYRQTYRR